MRGGVCLSWVYVHSSIYKTYLVKWRSRDLWSNVGGDVCPGYLCILLYIKLIWCSGVSEIYGEMWKMGYLWPGYMCILLYVKLIWCCVLPEIYGQM